MKKTSLYLFLIVSTLNISAQVTIGSDITPNSGALLDLKEWNESSGGVTSTKGLMLPRVDLSKNDLTPLGVDAGADGYMGTLVYNITDKDGLYPGLHVWSGKSWIPLFPSIATGDTSTKNLNRSTGLGTITDRDGLEYKVAKFGND